jgi:mono/diheme cytochrome c family protein
LFALAGALAWRAQVREDVSPSGPPRELDGRALYEQHCERCHAVDEFADAYLGQGSGLRVLELLEFLEQHGDADPLEDRAIAQFLATPTR